MHAKVGFKSNDTLQTENEERMIVWDNLANSSGFVFIWRSGGYNEYDDPILIAKTPKGPCVRSAWILVYTGRVPPSFIPPLIGTDASVGGRWPAFCASTVPCIGIVV